MVPNPEIIIKSNGTPNPTIITPTMPMAPTLPRAVAPPVGDMSISNINSSFDPIDLGASGNTIIPRLVLRQAPAREVLAVLGRYAGVNLIFTDSSSEGTGSTPDIDKTKTIATNSVISLDIANERVQEVFNQVLMVSGFVASKKGNTIFIGTKLPLAARNLITRTIRLNQALAGSAASFLSLQGAQTNLLRPETQRVVTDARTGVSFTEILDPRIIPLELDETRKKALGATILDGLLVSTDSRMNSVTLVGEPRLVELATTLLTQIDARRRQIAVNVKVVDINLNNIQDFNSSFSFGVGDGYFVQDNGAAVMRFGSTAPVSSNTMNSATGRLSNPPIITNPLSDANVFLDTSNPTIVEGINGGITSVFFPSVAGVSGNPTQTGLTTFTPAQSVTDNGVTTITAATAEYGLPAYFQYPKKFQAQVEAQIRSGNAKILTDPTLVVQEGQKAEVKLTQSVVGSINTQVDPLSGVRTTTPVLEDVGLNLAVIVNRIDDNGFISLEAIPIVSAPSGQQQFESGPGANNTITLINKRTLASGQLRMRDGQTLILTGVISESQQSVTSKVPILGDIPILGALFRSQSDTTNRSEVVIMLTPQIIHDNTESQFGYNYTPSKESADYLRQQGFPVQAQP